VYRLLVRKPEGKRPLGRPRCRWKENIKMDFFRDMMWWCGLAHDRGKCRALVNAVMNLLVPLNVGKLSSGYANWWPLK
jgi:hypothetical protein